MKITFIVVLGIVAAIGMGVAIAYPAKCDRSVTAGNMILFGCAKPR